MRTKQKKAKDPVPRVEVRSVFLTQDQIDRADEIAGKREWSRARLCRKAIELVLARPDLVLPASA